VVEQRPDHWQVFIYDPKNCEVLYAAERLRADAGKIAAVEFALAHLHGPKNDLKPEEVSEMLVWEKLAYEFEA
jgi:hypothetical protein